MLNHPQDQTGPPAGSASSSLPAAHPRHRLFARRPAALALIGALVVGLAGVTGLSAGSASAASELVVQAESFATQSGAQTEGTADTGGGLDVGWLAAGDWMSYSAIDLGAAGPLTVNLREASANASGGTVELHADTQTGTLLGSFAITSTGGWQTWATKSSTTTSTLSGKHTVFLTLKSSQSGDFVNLNWFSLVNGTTTTPTPTPTGSTTASGIASVAVINDVTKTPVAGLNPLLDGAVIDLPTLPNRNLSLQATPLTPAGVASVVFTLTGAKGTSYTRTESVAPYFLCNDYLDCPLLATPDSYTLTVQAYSATGASGSKVGGALVVHFTVKDATAAASVNVLYVGNSLIGTATGATGEDTPALVKHLATSAGQNMTFTEVIHFGNTLQQTYDAGEVTAALNGSTKYDYIVLQEYSTLVATNLTSARNTLLNTYAPKFAGALKPGGKVILFKDWALVDPAPFATRAANVAAINTNYAALAAALSTPDVLAPISDEFEKIIATHGTSYLIVADGKHPNDTAIYLDAATLYGILFHVSPRTLSDQYLAPATASSMRDVAATQLGY